MRELTEKEIENAPSWATEYCALESSVRFSNKNYYQWFGAKVIGGRNCFTSKSKLKTKPIPR
jgi:hypothetical protein